MVYKEKISELTTNDLEIIISKLSTSIRQLKKGLYPGETRDKKILQKLIDMKFQMQKEKEK